MSRFKRTAKVQNQEIKISEEVQSLIKKPAQALFTTPTKSEMELERELAKLQQEIQFKLQIDLSYCDETILPPCHTMIPLFGTEEEIKESLIFQQKEFNTRFKKLMSSKKRQLADKRDKIITQLIEMTIDEDFTKELFPRLLLYVEEIYKMNYDKIQPTYKMYEEEIKSLNDQLKKQLPETDTF